MRKAKIISIEVSGGDDGLFHATSPQLHELFVSGETLEHALSKVPEAIEGLFAIDGVEVRAVPADSQDRQIPEPWVILDRSLNGASC